VQTYWGNLVVRKIAGTLATGDIILELRKHGMSRRQAVYIFNSVLDLMRDALKQGEEVEWPFGSLKKVRQPRKPLRGWYLKRITTLYKKPFTVILVNEKEFKDPRIVKKEQKEEKRRLLESKLAELRRETAALIKLDAEARTAKFIP
jgi:hypothetical protein